MSESDHDAAKTARCVINRGQREERASVGGVAHGGVGGRGERARRDTLHHRARGRQRRTHCANTQPSSKNTTKKKHTEAMMKYAAGPGRGCPPAAAVAVTGTEKITRVLACFLL